MARDRRCVVTENEDVEPLHALGRLTIAEQDEVALAARKAVLAPAVEALLSQRRLPN